MTRRILDAHLHVWDLATTPQPWIKEASLHVLDRDFSVRDAVEVVAGAGVDGFVLVQTEHSLRETCTMLEESLVEQVHGVVGWVDLAGDTSADLDVLSTAPGAEALVGVRHLAHTESDEQWLLRSDVASGLDAVAARGLAFDLVLRPWQLPVAVAVARAHPGLRFVLDHLGNPPQDREEFARWSSVLQELAASENVVAKVSGLPLLRADGTIRPPSLEEVLDVAVSAFGPGRLMFGSDWPLAELSGGYRHWVDLYLGSTRSYSVDEQQAMDERTTLDTYRRTR